MSTFVAVFLYPVSVTTVSGAFYLLTPRGGLCYNGLTKFTAKRKEYSHV